MHFGSSRAVALTVVMLSVSAPFAQPAPSTAPSAATTPSASPAARHAPPTVWVYPLIRGYGGVHPRPDLPSGIVAGVDYKVIADVIHGDSDHKKVLGSLNRLARIANLFAYAGVPASHVHIAAVLEGPAGFAAFSNEEYRRRFKVDNPNLPLLHALKQAGVELMVCAQAIAEIGITDRDIAPDVTVTLSALSDFAVYGARGYSYLQL
ncbi:MAG TPA: DsrE family protein [Steroidobacteraceae bacterium]|nr:DsrE family protein [Steroidobacteraceae bacterium]